MPPNHYFLYQKLLNILDLYKRNHEKNQFLIFEIPDGAVCNPYYCW